ncbi:MAG: class I SAM-dependent RNA methyltransferase [Spirochaetaceae bacterium]|nr:class I SAM-dependent RNA methyltransferase [Spirochaetaceae bacterium]
MNTLVALCAVGAEKILANEIKFLGYKPIGNAPGRVFFTCPDEGLFRANLCLRTADRIYLQLASFYADNFDDLFDGVHSINWQDFLKKDTKVVVDKVRVYKSKLNSEHTIQGMTHKAIYKKLEDVWRMSVLPESGSQADIRIYLEQNKVFVLLDLSGEPLHKRGYRTDGGVAPIRETLACVLLQMMCWRRKTPLHDAFCGAGTIATEAALYAYNVAPGFGRHFALENLPIYNQEQAVEIRKQEAAKIRPDALARITGTDIDPEAVKRSQKNAEHACVTAGRALQMIGSDQRIQRPDFEVADFADIKAPYETGLLLSNPPYGERIGDEQEAIQLYKNMNSLFTDFENWEMGFITSHDKFEESIGKKASSIKNLKSGNLDTRFYMYKI